MTGGNMKLRLLLAACLLLLWYCQAVIWLCERVRSRMAAEHLVQADTELLLTIRNVRMWIDNEPGWYRRK